MIYLRSTELIIVNPHPLVRPCLRNLFRRLHALRTRKAGTGRSV